MGVVLGELLPSALGVALSPVPIVAVIVLLGSSRSRSQGPAFAFGWVGGITLLSVLVVALVGPAADRTDPSPAVAWLKVVLGVLFLWLALRQWRTRPAPGVEPEPPAWMASVDTLSVVRTVALGAALSALNPKNVALTLAAAATIAQLQLPPGETGGAVTLFVVLASLTVVGPVLFSLVAPQRAAAALAPIQAFMAAHNVVIMLVVLLLLGAKLLGAGLGAL